MATGFLDSLGLFATTMGAMLNIEDWAFVAPIFIGDTLRLELTIDALRTTSKGDAGVVRRHIKLLNQSDVVVQQGIITVLIRSRPKEDAADSESTEAISR